MSLGKIGKLNNTIKGLNNGIGTSKNLMNSLSDFGDINTAAKWLVRSNANEDYKTKIIWKLDTN